MGWIDKNNNYDFTSLYPHTMKNWLDDEKLMRELRLNKLKRERIEKLKNINKSSEL